MKRAIESGTGIQVVRVMLCDPPTVPKSEPLKWDGVSFINNILYSNNGIKVWQEYNIGEGKFIKWSEFYLPREISIPQIQITEDATSSAAQVKQKKLIAIALMMKRLIKKLSCSSAQMKAA